MYDALEFEWDADKEAINVRKHDGITFKLASRVWADKAHLIEFDRVEDGEERWHAIGATEAALLLVVHCYWEQTNGKEKIRIISAERLVSKSGADILNSPLSAEERAALARIAERQAADDDSGINFEDIPELTAEQLARAVRPAAKHLVTMRLDPDVVDWLRSYGEGYSTRANAILRAVMEKQR